MDQDAFRSILSQPSAGGSQASRYGQSSKQKKKTISATEPAFKPRKMKKEGKYRDRAAERREGDDKDYAQIEALLADIEQKADLSDDKRQLLGGDSEHTVLVRGLDIALLEQKKLRGGVSATADEDLEDAFVEVPQKRTREDLVRELKEKRSQGSAPTADAPIHTNSKFKPVGFKPIGASETEGIKKKKKVKTTEGDGKKKKRKTLADTPGNSNPPVVPDAVPTSQTVAINEEEPPEDIDIFADVGDYAGLDISGEEDDEADADARKREQVEALPVLTRLGGWFDEPPEALPAAATTSSLRRSASPPKPESLPPAEDEAEDDTPMRLVPLEGSTSVKEMLALDKAAASVDKKRKRKDKTKGTKDISVDGSKLTTEAKVDRDYKRLKSYQEKQAGSGKKPAL